MKKIIIVFAAALFGFPALPVRAATKTWDGSANGNWSVGANWSGGTAPVAGDDLVFPTSAAARRNTTNNFILGSARFRSLRFVGSDYKIYGAVIVLTNGILADGGGGFSATGTNTINAPIELRASQSLQLFANAPGAFLDINGDIALGSHTLSIENGGLGAFVYLSGAISGTGGITKNAGGPLRLDGISPNTYTGPTRINIGRLELNKGFFVSDTAVPGDLIVGNGTTASVRLLRDDQIADTSDVTVNDDGLLDLNGFDETIASLMLNAGEVDSGTGRLTLDGDVTATSTANGVATIAGELSLGFTSRRTFTVNDGPFSPDLRIEAAVSGFAGLGKAGAGELILNAPNLYTGSTVVQAGLLTVTDDGALGSTSSGTVVSNGATISVRFTTHIGGESLTLNGNGLFIGYGALSGGSGSNSWTGPITLASDASIGTADGAMLDLLSVIGGPGELTKIDGGTLIFSGGGMNTYTGATRVHEGTLLLRRSSFNRSIPSDLLIGDGTGGASSDVVRIESSEQINNSSAVTISASGLLDLNASSETIGSLAGFGRMDLAGNQLTVGGNDISTSYGGQILGTGNLIKNGSGAFTLTGDNPFSGALVVNQGSLLVNGAQPRGGAAVFGGALGGHGTVGHIHIEGNLAPGSSPGILSCSNLSFTSEGEYFVELNGSDAGSGYDQMNVRGTVNLANATLTASVGFNPVIGQTFTILSNDGGDPIQGTFANRPQGAEFLLNGVAFAISYIGGSGNEVVLTRIPVPRLAIETVAPASVRLFWPTNNLAFVLQFNTDLNAGGWASASPAPVIVGTNNVVTNAVSGTQKFYRLFKP